MEYEKDETFLARWMADSLSDAERVSFEQSEEGKQFLAIKNVSQNLVAPTYNVEEELAKFHRQKLNTKKQKQIFWVPRVAAAAAVIALIITSILVFRNPNKEYFTDIGESRNIELPDGSSVTLQSSSQLSFNKSEWSADRTVSLEGTAFFDVEKGSQFVITTKKGKVSVLGTSFVVKQRPSYLEVICYTGKVNVLAKDVSRDIEAGEGIRIRDAGTLDSWSVDRQIQWSDDIIKLVDVSVEEALEELKLVYPIEIVKSVNLDSISYTGSFPTNDLEVAIRLILEPNQIIYTFISEDQKLQIEGVE